MTTTEDDEFRAALKAQLADIKIVGDGPDGPIYTHTDGSVTRPPVPDAPPETPPGVPQTAT
jgi:hypothetical protein